MSRDTDKYEKEISALIEQERNSEKSENGFVCLRIDLVLSAIRAQKRKEKVAGELQLHSDQGFQYTSQAYFNLTNIIRHHATNIKTRKSL